MPRHRRTAVLVVKRTKEVKTGAGGSVYAIAGTPDLNLASKERKHTGVALVGNIDQITDCLFHCIASFWKNFAITVGDRERLSANAPSPSMLCISASSVR
jgi:hypothetical protein